MTGFNIPSSVYGFWAVFTILDVWAIIRYSPYSRRICLISHSRIHFMTRLVRLGSLLLLSSLFLAACSRPDSWGLLLWDNDENSLAAGQVVPIYIRSNINQVWVVGAPEGDPREDEKFEVPLWQIRQFSSQAKAREQADAYAEWTRLYGRTLLDGLPIRDEPTNTADGVYRLREGQIVKVLAKVEGVPVLSGGKPLPGDWLRVMTDDGTIGYTFSYRLEVFERASAKGTDSAHSEDGQADVLKRQFDAIVSRSWHPLSYLEMLKRGQVDLAAIGLQEGLYFDSAAQTLRFTLGDSRQVEDWGTVSSNSAGTWRFADGRVQIQISSDSTIQLLWPEASATMIELVSLPLSLTEIMAREKERRTLLLEALIRRGPVLESSDTGVLSLSVNGSFVWTGYDRLVPELIPAGLSGRGRVSMPLFLDPEARLPFTGAVRFSFMVDEAEKRTHVVDFLYALEPDGVRLQYAPPKTLNGVIVVERDNRAPAIFFTRARD